MKPISLKQIILSSIFLPLAFASPLAFAESFADFGFIGNGDDFSFRSTSTSASFYSTNSEINFKFDTAATGLQSSMYNFQKAKYSTTGSTTSRAAPFGSYIFQNIDFFRMSFTSSSGKNLLSVVVSNLDPDSSVAFFGTKGTYALGLLAGQPAHKVEFTSDFLDFTSSTTNTASFHFDMDHNMPKLGIGTNGFLKDFDASESGTFSSDGETAKVTPYSPPISEPETYAQFMGGLGLLSFITRKLQRRS